MRMNGAWLVTLTLLGCAPGAAGSSLQDTGATRAAPPPSSDTPAPGEEVREGVLVLNKGGHPMIGEVFLPDSSMARHLGADWKKTAVGKRVRARGALERTRCPPDADCVHPDNGLLLRATMVELLER